MLDYIVIPENGTYSFKNLVTTVEMEVDIFRFFLFFCGRFVFIDVSELRL